MTSIWPAKTRSGSCFRTVRSARFPRSASAYELDVIVDDSIQAQPDVYLEGGDHATLVHMDQAQFARLMAEARHGRFSVHD